MYFIQVCQWFDPRQEFGKLINFDSFILEMVLIGHCLIHREYHMSDKDFFLSYNP